MKEKTEKGKNPSLNKKYPTEYQIQCAIIEWFDLKYPEYSQRFFHIPNGGYRDKFEAFRLVKSGVRKGVSDLMLAVPYGNYHGMFLEIKSFKGKLSKYQREFLLTSGNLGYYSCVANTLEQGIFFIDGYMNHIFYKEQSYMVEVFNV